MDSPALATEPVVSITTFKRDGTPVSVPVWCAADNRTLLVFAAGDSWKVKRIRRDPHVRLAPCSARGKPRGPAVDADASLVEETTTVQALLARKYGWAWRGYRTLTLLTATIRRLRRQVPAAWLTIRITLREASPAQPNRRGSGRVRPARSGPVRQPTPGLPGIPRPGTRVAGGQGKTGPALAGRSLGSGCLCSWSDGLDPAAPCVPLVRSAHPVMGAPERGTGHRGRLSLYQGRTASSCQPLALPQLPVPEGLVVSAALWTFALTLPSLRFVTLLRLAASSAISSRSSLTSDQNRAR
jgi:PPOX class probable F420-dependent enzyme